MARKPDERTLFHESDDPLCARGFAWFIENKEPACGYTRDGRKMFRARTRSGGANYTRLSRLGDSSIAMEKFAICSRRSSLSPRTRAWKRIGRREGTNTANQVGDEEEREPLAAPRRAAGSLRMGGDGTID